MAFHCSSNKTLSLPQLWLLFMLIIFKCYLQPIYIFFKSQSYTFTCLLETLLVIWQLKSSVQTWILFFFPKHNLFCYPLLSEYNYSPSFTSYSVFFPESSSSPNSGDDQVLPILSVYHLSGLLPFLPFHCFYLSQAFIIFLVYLSKYFSNLSDWFQSLFSCHPVSPKQTFHSSNQFSYHILYLITCLKCLNKTDFCCCCCCFGLFLFLQCYKTDF